MFILLCLISTSALVSAARTDCIDAMAGCEKLSAVYCLPPYEQYARDACPRRCGFCEEESVQKRSHGHVSWVDHCWDQGHDHLQDPFCALLTTTIPTTTTPKPTTTTVTTTTTTTVPTTTTTTPPTTTTTMPTTTTTMTTTTTTMTTTTEPPTTTPRNCRYDMINDKDIHNTDFATDVELIENANTTFNESVHLISDIEFCQGVCAQSVLNDGYECWAFTFNEQDRCYLYYYSRPLYLIEAGGLFVNGTTLFLKRCSDDPSTPAPPTQATTTTTMPTTMAPVDESTTTTLVTGPPNQTPGGIIMINQNTYSKLGGPTPVPNTCYFLNQTFALGEHFKDSCRFDCLCDDVTVNRAVCTNVCPFYTSIPDYCSLVQRNGECCAELDCQNATDTTNMTGSGDGGDCDNTIDQCDFYPDSACVNVYEPWARAHCALRCGYCPGKTEPCVDRIAYCRLYELDTACKAYAGWARHNCKQSCAIC